jgi:UrcA family protein
MRALLLVAAAALSLSALSPASAAQPIEVRVGYGDLDLRDARDVRSLERRLARAIKYACAAPVALAPTPGVLACREDGMAQAQQEIARHRARVSIADARTVR